MSASTRAAIYRIASPQAGVIAVRQATRIGIPRGLLPAWAKQGEAVRVGHGLYRLVAWPDTWHARAVAASLTVHRVGALSHFAAARTLGLPLTRNERDHAPIEVTYLRRRRLEQPPVTAHESNVLRRDDLCTVDAVQLTGAVFTVAALASRMHKNRFGPFVDATIAQGHVSRNQLIDMAARLWACPGVPQLREAIDLHHPALGLTRSERERMFFRLLRDAGLPLPDVDVEVTDAAGQTRYLDFAYLELALWIEFDSARFHEGSVARRADGHRQNNLVLLGGRRWIPLRFDDRDLFDDPEGIVRQVRAALVALANES